MAIDPTAPVTPITPLPATGARPEPATALAALARAAVAANITTLAEIAAGAQVDPYAGDGVGKPAATAADARAASLNGSRAAAPAQASPERSVSDRLSAAVRSAVAHAAPVQSGLAATMADIEAVVVRPETPGPVRQAARAVLESAIPTQRPVSSAVVRSAVQGSGVFLEAHLARAATTEPSTAPTAAIPSSPSDMKAALLVFRAVVSTWLAKMPAAEPRPQQAVPSQPSLAPRPETGRVTYGQGAVTQSAAEQPDDPANPLRRVAAGLSAEPGRPAPTAAPQAPPPGAPVQPSISGASAHPPVSPPPLPPPPGVSPPMSSPPVSPSAQALPLTDGPEPSPAPPLPQDPAAKPAPAMAPRAAAAPPPQPFLMVGRIEDEVLEPLPLAEKDGEAVAHDPRSSLPPAYGRGPVRPPPPYAGGPTSAQAVVPSDLPDGLAPAELARRLLKSADGAIARQELLQIASLPEPRAEAERPIETRGSRWVFDLPFLTPQGIAVAQFEISRDGGGGGSDPGREVERTWRARFSLDVEPLGPVHVQIALTGALTRVGLWAERPDAMARLQAGEAALSAALREAELSPEVAFHTGSPTVAVTEPGHFVDRAS